MNPIQLISLFLSVSALLAAILLVSGWVKYDLELHKVHRDCIKIHVVMLLLAAIAQSYVSFTDSSNAMDWVKICAVYPILASIFYYRTLSKCRK